MTNVEVNKSKVISFMEDDFHRCCTVSVITVYEEGNCVSDDSEK